MAPSVDHVVVRTKDLVALEAWLRLLNSKVFFWPAEERVRALLGALAYRGREHPRVAYQTADQSQRMQLSRGRPRRPSARNTLSLWRSLAVIRLLRSSCGRSSLPLVVLASLSVKA